MVKLPGTSDCSKCVLLHSSEECLVNVKLSKAGVTEIATCGIERMKKTPFAQIRRPRVLLEGGGLGQGGKKEGTPCGNRGNGLD